MSTEHGGWRARGHPSWWVRPLAGALVLSLLLSAQAPGASHGRAQAIVEFQDEEDGLPDEARRNFRAEEDFTDDEALGLIMVAVLLTVGIAAGIAFVRLGRAPTRVISVRSRGAPQRTWRIKGRRR